ncbi:MULTISPECIES: hypothetical protein [unclassified Haloarcula]|uniref:hypothetical protein n=1 Tax=unclassified Haloarcula TaxID=2624677 RepID=UPI0006790774|nr:MULTISPECIES: hypothetical protein [unclassified Haloarcula]
MAESGPERLEMESTYGQVLAVPFVAPLLVVDVGLESLIQWINEQLFNAVFELIEILFSSVLSEMLKLEPSMLDQFQSMWDLSMVIYFSLLTIFGLSYLGLFQLFPDNEKMDPYRFMSRALAATLSLFIVNPPGSGTLFSRGAFAWAFSISNASIDLFLKGVNLNASLPSNPVAQTSVGSFVMLLYGIGILLVVVLSQIVLFVVLVARQVLVYLTYGLFPLLIIFWVADVGPLKYAKELAEQLFKATGMLIPGGILVAGIFAVGTKFTTRTLSTFSGGGTGGTTTAVFASGPNPLIQMAMPAMAIAAMCLLSNVQLFMMFAGSLGGAAGAAAGKVSKGLSAGKNKVTGAVGIGGTGGTGGSGPTPPSQTGVVASTVPMEGGATDSQSGSSVTDNTAQDLSATSAVAPEGGGTDSQSGTDTTQPENPSQTSGPYKMAPVSEMKSGSSGGGADDSGQASPPDLTEMDADTDPEQLGTAFENATAEERGEFLQQNMQQDSMGSGRKLLGKMMGPAGGAVAGAAVTALGLSGGLAVTAGTVALAGTITFAGEQMNKKGIRDGISNTVSAVSDLTVGSYSEFKESMADARTAYEEASNGSGSATNNETKFE